MVRGDEPPSSAEGYGTLAPPSFLLIKACVQRPRKAGKLARLPSRRPRYREPSVKILAGLVQVAEAPRDSPALARSKSTCRPVTRGNHANRLETSGARGPINQSGSAKNSDGEKTTTGCVPFWKWANLAGPQLLV